MTTAADMPSQSKAGVPLTGKIGYGVGISGLWLVFMTTAIYHLYYYTNVFGLSPRQAGLVLFVALLWDAVTDPIMGWLTSRTRTRLGRYRPYILFGGLPLACAFVLSFMKPDWIGTNLFVYAVFTQLLFRLTFTAVYIPYTAMIARLSSDANERASIASVKTIFVAIGSLAVSFYGLPAVDYFGGGNDQRGFLITAMVFGAVAVVALTICGGVTREREVGDSDGPGNVAQTNEVGSPLEAIKLLFNNSPFMRVFFGVILFTGCYTVLNKLTVYYFAENLDARAEARWALSAVSLAGILSPVLWAYITTRTSKRFVWVSGALLASAALISFYVLHPTDVMVIAAYYFVTGCGIQAILMTFYAMAADTIDYGEWRQGRRTEGIGFGLLSFANKSSLAVGGGLLGVLLAEIGYEAGASQSQETLAGIRLSLSLIPTVGFLASAVVIAFFSLNAKRHGEIIQELQVRRTKNKGHKDAAG